jgi:septum formation protein
MGVSFRAVPVDVDESMLGEGAPSPSAVALRRAAGKAAAAGRRAPEALVLAADTLVVAPDGQELGKPRTADRNRLMLQALSGRRHSVFTAVVLRAADQERSSVELCRVVFRDLTSLEQDAYAASGEGWDKAGGYAIQGVASAFIQRIEGDYTAVVGLPLCRLSRLLAEFGIHLGSG